MPPASYKGPKFKLSYRYPTTPPAPPTNPPWFQALGGKPISGANAIAYVSALKDYVANDIKTLLLDYPAWDAAARGWYNEPWIFCEREAIHGMYAGSPFPAGTFTGQTADMWTWVVTYYDAVAAYSLSQVWGTTAMQANLANNAAQFPEGSVIVKLAFTTATPQNWPVLTGAPSWTVYIQPLAQDETPTGPVQLTPVSLLQIDFIVKDTRTAPKTGWVFSTAVYDQSVQGDGWARMVPLGAMWGNDPQVTSPTGPLKETVINPTAPAYSKETLGWGGRLSGPNDDAVAAPAIINGQQVASQPASSCMSCHSPAEWPRPSFIMPSPSPQGQPGEPTMQNGAMVLYTPASAEWMRWFQDRNGTTPQDKGSIALDFDMVYSFKSLPAWAAATKQAEAASLPTRGKSRFHRSRRYAAQ